MFSLNTASSKEKNIKLDNLNLKSEIAYVIVAGTHANGHSLLLDGVTDRQVDRKQQCYQDYTIQVNSKATRKYM